MKILCNSNLKMQLVNVMFIKRFCKCTFTNAKMNDIDNLSERLATFDVEQ